MRRFVIAFAVAVVACTISAARDGGPHPHQLSQRDPNAPPGCGDGFCEAGETHANCPNDCCELDGSGGCIAACGNGFCEVGETHASCPSDCCEETGSGACVAVCGNGFCEAGEDHDNCPGDCC